MATASTGNPGRVIEANNEGIVVATGDRLIRIERLQLAGRKSMPAGEFIRSQPIVNAQLGS